MKTQNERNTLLASQIARLANAMSRELGERLTESIIKNLDEEFDIMEKQHGCKLPITLLNTTIATTDGVYEIKTIGLEEAINLVSSCETDSAVGHDSTAAIMTELLGVSVKVNRQMFAQKVGQKALVFKLKGRPPEGKILSKDEIDKIGYEFKLMARKS